MGNQPPGTMDVSIDNNKSIAGYDGDGMIIITYNIHSGIQVRTFLRSITNI